MNNSFSSYFHTTDEKEAFLVLGREGLLFVKTKGKGGIRAGLKRNKFIARKERLVLMTLRSISLGIFYKHFLIIWYILIWITVHNIRSLYSNIPYQYRWHSIQIQVFYYVNIVLHPSNKYLDLVRSRAVWVWSVYILIASQSRGGSNWIYITLDILKSV